MTGEQVADLMAEIRALRARVTSLEGRVDRIGKPGVVFSPVTLAETPALMTGKVLHMRLRGVGGTDGHPSDTEVSS